VIIPTGGIEQNGPYLQTGKHNVVLRAACEGIARELGNALCAPILALVPEGGIDPPTSHMRYPGTISLREDTYRAVLDDMASSLRAHGFQHIVFIGDSGGNQSGMQAVAASLNERWGANVAHFIPEFYRYADVFEYMENELGITEPEREGLHDDYVITAIMMTVDPSTVRYDQRVAAGKASINGLSIEPKEKTIEIGRKLLQFRVDQTVTAIRAAIAGASGGGEPQREVAMSGTGAVASTPEIDTAAPWPPVATFSILGFDPETGEVGGAVQSRVFSVGNGVLWAEAGVGAAATQAIVDVSYGPQAITLLRQNVAPAEVVKRVLDADMDPRPENWSKQGRQFAVIDTKGAVAAFTGPRATEWAGNKSCDQQTHFCTAQGNILAGEAVVNEMVRAFQETDGHLSLRLLAALEAGQAAGGDRRGMQSAAMLIVREDGGVWLNNDVVLRLQVDDHATPIAELRRLVEIAARQRGGRRR
jgi:uncharacterized Ntn-hydrolase superfamily protein/creatinine amidohydrolase/Fe(II)-dependent formamide hydrolase-like protein